MKIKSYLKALIPSVRKLAVIYSRWVNLFICFFNGHKIIANSCVRCSEEFGIPKSKFYPEPPLVGSTLPKLLLLEEVEGEDFDLLESDYFRYVLMVVLILVLVDFFVTYIFV